MAAENGRSADLPRRKTPGTDAPDATFTELENIVRRGETPPWLQRFVRTAGRGINEHAMIAEGAHVLVGISGGKDSLSLALALSLRRRWLPINYTVEAIHVDWREHALTASDRQALERYFAAIDVPFTSIPMSMFPPSHRLPLEREKHTHRAQADDPRAASSQSTGAPEYLPQHGTHQLGLPPGQD